MSLSFECEHELDQALFEECFDDQRSGDVADVVAACLLAACDNVHTQQRDAMLKEVAKLMCDGGCYDLMEQLWLNCVEYIRTKEARQ
jgi:hypothetical protein